MAKTNALSSSKRHTFADLVLQTVCNQLSIPLLSVRFSSELPTHTMMGFRQPKQTSVTIDDAIRDPLLLTFALAHEARHVWQEHYAPQMLASYSPSEQVCQEDYNLQPAEVDANAYASLVTASAFGCEPVFDSLSPCVLKAIKARMREIQNEIEF